MKPREAAALALLGWYLMFPPPAMNTKNSVVDVDAPIGKCTIWASYDAVKDCEAERSKKQQEFLRLFQEALRSEKDPRNSSPRTASFFLTRDMTACIATDDPRLKEP